MPGKVEPLERTIHLPCDDVRVDRAPLPPVRIRGRDPIAVTRLVNAWLQRTAVTLDTRSGLAAFYWTEILRAARQQRHLALTIPCT